MTVNIGSEHSSENVGLDSSLETMADYVNRELAGLSLPSPLQFGTHSGAGTVIQCLFTLLQQLQREKAFRSEMQERFNQLNFQNDDLIAQNNRFKSKLETANRESKALAASADTFQKSLKEVTEKLNASREEVKFYKSQLSYAKTQYQHEVRKKARECDKLKERLTKSVTDNKSAKVTIANPLPSAKSINAKPRAKKDSNEEMYNIIVTSYEEREKDVMAENRLLRQSLALVYAQLHNEIVNTNPLLLNEADVDGLAPPNSDPKFELPFEMSKDWIETSIRKGLVKFRALKERLLTYKPEQVQELEAQIKALKLKEKRQEQLIEEHNHLLELALQPDMQSSKPSSKDVSRYQSQAEDLEFSIAELEKVKADLDEQRRQLDVDRKKFTEAAIRMGLERANLQKERQALESEKLVSSTNAILDTLPPTPSWLRSKLEPSVDTSNSKTPGRTHLPTSDSTRPTPGSFGDGISSVHGLDLKNLNLDGTSPSATATSDILNEINTFLGTPAGGNTPHHAISQIKEGMNPFLASSVKKVLKSALRPSKSQTNTPTTNTPGSKTRVRLNIQAEEDRENANDEEASESEEEKENSRVFRRTPFKRSVLTSTPF